MKRKLSIVLLAALVMTGCTKDESSGNLADKELISFVTMTDETRASRTDKDDIYSYGVTCAICPKTDSFSSVGCGSYFFNEVIDAEAGKSSNYWPGENYNLSFFIHTPCNDGNIQVISNPTDKGYPVYQYTEPADITRQADLMTANIIDHVGLSRVPLTITFNHMCTDVRFSVENQGVENLIIKSITLVGVKHNGTLKNNTWTLTGSANTASDNPFVLTANTNIADGYTSDVTGTDRHFILLPQTVTAGTELIIVKTVLDGVETTFTHTLPANMTFAMGKSYTFNITLNQKMMIVDPETDIEDWTPEQIDYISQESDFGVQDWSEED